MPEAPLPTGKLPGRLLAELLSALPTGDPAVRLGPAPGEDAAAIDLAGGTLVAATDPVTLTSRDAGRYAVLVNANDVAVTGVAPRWFLVTLLLPPGSAEADVRTLFATLTDTLDEVGATLVGGHTEITPAVRETVVVGQMLGFAPDRSIVTTGGAAPGDVVVQVGPVPVEGAAVLAAEAADLLAGLPPGQLEAAAGAVEDPGISVVAPALRAAELGASAMHDPTEGGLAAGLHELAEASRVALAVDPDAIAWFGPGTAVCEELGCDPWSTLASGCLLATFPARVAHRAVDLLVRDGHAAVAVGRVEEGRGVRVGGNRLARPERDELARRLEG
jgi:hydrogenase expression/formation protein HypE